MIFRTNLRRCALVLALVTAMVACGGRDAVDSATAFVADLARSGPTKRTASVAPGVDAESLLDWAQWKFPSLFPQAAATQVIKHLGVVYDVRAYAGGNFLGVSRQGEVWGLGPFTNGQLQSFGAVALYAAQVQADRCQVYAARCAPASALDQQLRSLIVANGLSGDPTVGRELPHIGDAMPQLGKLLFFSKSLSVQRDTACASCHHPALGGGDGMGLSVGASASQHELLGLGRQRPDGHLLVARNANTFFNTALYDRVLFADGRVESLLAPGVAPSPGGVGTVIRTPASVGGGADPAAGPNLLAAQARFPITGAAEMRGDGLAANSDDEVRSIIAKRLADEAAGQAEGQGWLPHFRRAFGQPQGTAQQLITFDNIMRAIAEYQRSASFVKSPWQRYVLGENTALSDEAKIGAIFFYKPVAQGGGACVQCHKGDFFTDEKFHAVGFAQTGPGFAADRTDFGRERVTGNLDDRFRFRTPSLLNVAVTGPWGHAGNYNSLFMVVDHYAVPDDTVATLLNSTLWCYIPGYAQQPNCTAGQGDARRESNASLAKMRAVRLSDPANAMPEINLRLTSPAVSGQVGQFMESLTDPCVLDRACRSRWIPRADEAPDAHQLNAVNERGERLQ